MSSSKLAQLFTSLPPEAQQVFVEKHLVGLLDLMPKEKSKKVLSAATSLQRKYKAAPNLDLLAKRKEIGSLFNELARDAKVSFIKERSNRDELLSEVMHSLVSWLNDIWSVAYEHNVNFLVAHSCLLFIADALTQLSESSTLGGCKCSVMNLPVEFILRDKKGRVVKRFSVLGPQNIDRILLWIWRDLFVSLLARGSERDKKKVPDLLEEIEMVLGVDALERLLYGGRPNNDDDDDDYEDVEDSEEDDEDFFSAGQSCTDGDSDYESDASDRCTCSFHAHYWTERLNRERIPLRECVEKRLFSIFRVTPSIRIYNTLLAISRETVSTEIRISRVLSEIAGDTPDNLVAALDIHIANGEQSKIASLLKSYSYLLRPRDAGTLQCAVAMLDDSLYHARSLAILEKELDDCLQAIYATIRTCFSHIEDGVNKKDILEVLKLQSSSSTRQERISQWVDRVATPSSGPMHPMAFAAIMMGLPMLPGSDDGDDADILNYVDLDQNDPDLDDVREEYRPDLKGVFDGWTHLGQSMKGGPVILAKLYIKALELMPWLRGPDIVNEMANKLRERPNKSHILDALTNLSSFSKVQRRKLKLARSEQQRRTANKAQAGPAASQPSGSQSTSTNPPRPPATPPFPPPAMAFTFGALPVTRTATPPLPFPFPPVPGGMEDVD